MIEQILCGFQKWIKSLEADHALKTVLQSQPAKYFCCMVFVCICEDLKEPDMNTGQNLGKLRSVYIKRKNCYMSSPTILRCGIESRRFLRSGSGLSVSYGSLPWT